MKVEMKIQKSNKSNKERFTACIAHFLSNGVKVDPPGQVHLPGVDPDQ